MRDPQSKPDDGGEMMSYRVFSPIYPARSGLQAAFSPTVRERRSPGRQV